MPVYRYRAVDEDAGCTTCSPGFEQRQRIHEEPLAACAACGAPIQRILFAPYVAGGDAHRLREGHLEKHGFTQYRRVGKGRYEKTAGRGPDTLADDGR